MHRCCRLPILAGIVLLVAPLRASEPAKAALERTPNPKLAALPENAWTKVAGFAPTSAGILSYSGGVFDSVHGQFLLFGGGHADYWGNEVCAFDTATLTWKKMYEPDAQARYTSENIDNEHGRLKDSDKPYTRHTYNQLCFVKSNATMFIFGGCGPGWGNIKPTCPVPPDTWSYSFAENKWTPLFAGKGAPGGYAKACCYDAKRDVVWAFSGGTTLHRFDLKSRAWSVQALKGNLSKAGGYNFQMEYLDGTDRVLLLGNEAFSINPETFEVEGLALSQCRGKAGLTYAPDLNAGLYLVLPGGETGPEQRLAVYDCAKKTWNDVACEFPKEMKGAIWDRFHYDSVNKVALVVLSSGVWAYKPPKTLPIAVPAPAAEASKR